MSSKKNWPSMFKSKSCNNHHHKINTPSYMHYSNCNISSSFSADHEPDPKPRWNPKPEQLRILESIFNSGTINPPREEIQRIRIQLQEYGHIGDANVFYWFQNRKSRAKNKLRVLHKNPKLSKKEKIISPSNDADLCFGLVNQGIDLFPDQNNVTEPASFIFSAQPDFGSGDFAVPVVTEEGIESSAVNKIPANNFYSEDGNIFSPISVHVTVPLTIGQSQVLSRDEDVRFCASPVKLNVFINDMPFEVVAGLFTVRETFGNDAVLMNSFGQPILTDEFGVTFEPLQDGAVYYLNCSKGFVFGFADLEDIDDRVL